MAKKKQAPPEKTARQIAAANRIRIGGKFVNKATAEAVKVIAKANGIKDNAEAVNRFVQQNEKDIVKKVYGWKELTPMELNKLSEGVSKAKKIYTPSGLVSNDQMKLDIALLYNFVSSNSNIVNMKLPMFVNIKGEVKFNFDIQEFLEQVQDESEPDDLFEMIMDFCDENDIIVIDSPKKSKK